MKFKLTPKQEKFCQVFMETSNASEAYRRVYNAANMKDTTINVAAKQLLDNNKVASRLEELRERGAKKLDITIEKLTAMLLEDRQLAYTSGKPGDAVSATMAIAKLHGQVIERQNVNVKSDNRHHHTTRTISDTAEWIAGTAGRAGTDRTSEKPVLQ